MSYSSAFILLLLATALTSCYANNLGLDFHHRFSDKVREWTDSRGLPPAWNPEEAPRGSVEYYQALLKHDLHRHRGRSLAAGDLYAFASGNETIEYLGNLHYAFVDIGTPNQTFLVALDTGSDLFWVPCNCKQCAPTSDPSYGKIEFSNYDPSASTTSKAISCSSNQCFTTSRNQCPNTTADCTYTVPYGSPNTSSSGTIVQDDLYLLKESITSDVVKIPILFGCGEVQTGSFLDGGAPNGLMGLGLSQISVPSIIANNSLISITDSFSMCFGTDGYGRLNFGDEGSPDQNETSLNINPYGFYNISLTEIVVGNTTNKLPFDAVVDSGSSYSGFTDNIYKKIATSFSAQVSERPITIEGSPFEYCFEISANQTKLKLPPVSFTTQDGSSFHALHPAIGYAKQNSDRLVAYCLAILQYDMNIIGENFLVGQKIVFDRKKQVLGWEPFNCSSNKHISPAATPPSTPAPKTPPPKAPAPSPPTRPNSALARPVGFSTIISVVASLISLIFM
ncbi:Eukaryotic aspartyl protease family protein [Rhynchospora pubera]|uniref:Eukaryotic aspartyl protease family protein n=1 Tax=Rhynchospora pubera TaxID=906938 RepID=A0AAV8EAT9_9POAL|nr:Eukaryotic aspartyl protease family protein [Rhynchospora pubera]